MDNFIQAEMTIQLKEHVEKTKERQAFDRFYRFSMPIGTNFEIAIEYAKAIVRHVEEMQKKSKEAEEKLKKEAAHTSEEEKK